MNLRSRLGRIEAAYWQHLLDEFMRLFGKHCHRPTVAQAHAELLRISAQAEAETGTDRPDVSRGSPVGDALEAVYQAVVAAEVGNVAGLGEKP